MENKTSAKYQLRNFFKIIWELFEYEKAHEYLCKFGKILSYFVIFVMLSGMRSPAARNTDFYDVRNSMIVRSEVRNEYVNVLDVSEHDTAVMERAVPYLERLGYKVQRFDKTNRPTKVWGNFDFIFYKPENGQVVQATVGNLLLGLRDDGVLFVRAQNKGDGMAAIIAAQSFGYEIIKEDMLIVVKKKFYDQELFRVFSIELNEIMETGRSA